MIRCAFEVENTCRHLDNYSAVVLPGECRQHCPVGASQESRIRGLGDVVAKGLDAVGITKDRVQAVASRVGIGDCGCQKRQDALNRMFPLQTLNKGDKSE